MNNKRILLDKGEEDGYGWRFTWEVKSNGEFSGLDGKLSTYKLSQKGIRFKKQAYMSGKCRNKGFTAINDYFPGSRAHHLTRDLVIFIPRKLHEKFNGKHNVHKPETMVQINMEVLNWLMKNPSGIPAWESKNSTL